MKRVAFLGSIIFAGVSLLISLFLLLHLFNRANTLKNDGDLKQPVEVGDYSPTSAIAQAKSRGHSFRSLEEEALQYGLNTFVSSDGEYYKQIKSRLVANRSLVAALLTAQKEDVSVYPSGRFSVGDEYLEIDVNATDEEIINFLLGK